MRERLIGLAITYATLLQVTWGSTRPALGNQAYALGCPAGRHPPIVFDTATTAICWVGTSKYAPRGKPIPPDVAPTDKLRSVPRELGAELPESLAR
jgi:LDH2 family malate/lactate/ureidoglycolate dehydrogenase